MFFRDRVYLCQFYAMLCSIVVYIEHLQFHIYIRELRSTYQLYLLMVILLLSVIKDGSVAEWLVCWTQAQKGLGSNRSRDAVQ